MEQGLKERLVGAAVLVLLAVVFVPMVLDGPDAPPAATPTTLTAVASGQSTFRYDLEAPLPGATPATAPAASATTVATAPVPSAAVAAKPEPKPVAPAAPVAAAPKPAPKSVAPTTDKPVAAVSAGWAAQVGSFSKEATAQAVAADLKAKGFKSFVMPHRDGKTTLYRVRVGPVATRDAADALAKKITAKTGQAARPVPHP